LALLRRHGAASRAPPRHRPPRLGPHYRTDRDDADAAGARARLRTRRERLLRRVRLGFIRRTLRAHARRRALGHPRGGPQREGRPARLRPLEAGRRGAHHALALPVGRRVPGLARS
jgi:hypothetical protein